MQDTGRAHADEGTNPNVRKVYFEPGNAPYHLIFYDTFYEHCNYFMLRDPAGQRMTFPKILDRRGGTLEDLIEINPAKQGRFVAMSGLPIYSPEVATPLIDDWHEIYVDESYVSARNPGEVSREAHRLPVLRLNREHGR